MRGLFLIQIIGTPGHMINAAMVPNHTKSTRSDVMFTVTKQSQSRVDIDISGGLDSNIMSAGLDALLDASQGVEHGQMLYTIRDFELPTLGALGIEMSYLGKLFGLLGKFDRCAVLCDAGWIRTAAEVEGALIPGLKIKAFQLDEEKAAVAWLEV